MELKMNRLILLMILTPCLTSCGSIKKAVSQILLANSILGLTPLIFSSIALFASIVIQQKTKTKAARIFLIISTAGWAAQFFGIFGAAGIFKPTPIIAAIAVHSVGIIIYSFLLPKYSRQNLQSTTYQINQNQVK